MRAGDRPNVPALHVLVRSLEQLRAVLDLGERALYADFADIRQYRDAVALARAAGGHAPPRHAADPEARRDWASSALLAKQEPDGVLVRNCAGAAFFRDRGLPVVGDFSLNVTNELIAGVLSRGGRASG